MEKVYQQLGTPSGDTDYFIWRTRTKTERKSNAQARLRGLVPDLLSTHHLASHQSRPQNASLHHTVPQHLAAHHLAAEILKLG